MNVGEINNECVIRNKRKLIPHTLINSHINMTDKASKEVKGEPRLPERPEEKKAATEEVKEKKDFPKDTGASQGSVMSCFRKTIGGH